MNNAGSAWDRWERFRQWQVRSDAIGFGLDVSRMSFPDDYIERIRPAIDRAFVRMRELEAGAIANPDEGRRVGHYWLRNPDLAPEPSMAAEIRATRERIAQFAGAIHAGEIRSGGGERFQHALLIGIGGSALGPQLVSDALAPVDAPIPFDYLDNTDPAGMQRVFRRLGASLGRTLVIVISKSGETRETRNGMLETRAALECIGAGFPANAVAVTGCGSELDRQAQAEGWLARFPMWDWVGGRTSVTGPVGLLPAALQRIDIAAFLRGAAAMDDWTRTAVTRLNPAMLLALLWHWAGRGRGERAMVVLPYSDRLVLLGRYLQQLVMESIGKAQDLDGAPVAQGITVYGNKGSTDQHAYVQQLRDGPNDFFVTFVEVRRVAGESPPIEVEPGVTSADYLEGFLRGTRAALSDGGRESITVSVDALTPLHLGALVALFERAVGFYATLVNVNAYHQPGVQAGKQAAAAVLDLQRRIVSALRTAPAERAWCVGELATELGVDPEGVHHVLMHLAATRPELTRLGANDPAESVYRWVPKGE